MSNQAKEKLISILIPAANASYDHRPFVGWKELPRGIIHVQLTDGWFLQGQGIIQDREHDLYLLIRYYWLSIYCPDRELLDGLLTEENTSAWVILRFKPMRTFSFSNPYNYRCEVSGYWENRRQKLFQ